MTFMMRKAPWCLDGEHHKYVDGECPQCGQLERPAWAETWMQVAWTMAARSYDPRLQVGAIIVSEDNTQMLSVGYNGNYKGGPHQHESSEPGKAVVTDPVATGLLSFDGTDGTSAIGTPCLDAGTGGPIADCDFGTVTCTGVACTAMCGVNATAFNEIFAEMLRVMPRLTPANVSIRYVPNGFGFVGYRIPATVTVSVVGLNYDFFALSAFQSVFPVSMPLPPSPATLTGEDFDS